MAHSVGSQAGQAGLLDSLSQWGLMRWFVFAVIIGFLRNTLEVLFSVQITPVWYSWNLDIVLSLVFGVTHLLFFGGMILDIFGRLLNMHISPKSLLPVCAGLQVLHLAIPVLDAFGQNKMGWPSTFHYVVPPIRTPFFTTDLVMTTGIICAWIATWIVLILFYKKQGYALRQIALLLFLSYQFILWPVYHLWPTTNYVYYHLLLRHEYTWSLDYAGYVWYFVLASFGGMIYFHRRYRIPWW